MEENKFLIYAEEILEYFKERLNYYSGLFQHETNNQILADCYWSMASILLNFRHTDNLIELYISKANHCYSTLPKEIENEGKFLIKITECEFLYRAKQNQSANDKLEEFLQSISGKNYYFYLIGYFSKLKYIIDLNESQWLTNLDSFKTQLTTIKYNKKDQNFEDELDYISQLIDALKLKSKKRLFQKGKAMEILQKLLHKQSIYQEIVIVQYLGLLLDEIKLYFDSDAIKEFKTLIKQLVKLGSRTINFQLIMQSFFLNELIELLSNENDKNIKDNMNQFEKILSKFSEFNLLEDFDIEKKKFFDIINKFNNNKLNFSNYQNVESLELENYLKEVSKIVLKSPRFN